MYYSYGWMSNVDKLIVIQKHPKLFLRRMCVCEDAFMDPMRQNPQKTQNLCWMLWFYCVANAKVL